MIVVSAVILAVAAAVVGLLVEACWLSAQKRRAERLRALKTGGLPR